MIVDAAIDFIKKADTNPIIDTTLNSSFSPPFYVNVWLHVSHDLLNPSAAQKAACVASSPRCACRSLSDNQTTCANEIFWSAQQDADAQIGRLLDTLQDLNLKESTLVAFSTDNGPEERMVYTSAVGSAGPFRGRKRSLYEGGIRVPFIVSWGGTSPYPRVAPHTIDNTVLTAADWLPTVAALANITLAPSLVESLDGEDMSAAIVRLNSATTAAVEAGGGGGGGGGGGNGVGRPLLGANRTVRLPAPRPTRPMLFWEWRFPVAGACDNSAPQLAVREGRYKLLRDIANASQGGRVELYDLGFYNATAPDYNERFNLAALPDAPYQDVVDRLSTALMEWHSHLPPGPYTLAAGCGSFPYLGHLSPQQLQQQHLQQPQQQQHQSWGQHDMTQPYWEDADSDI